MATPFDISILALGLPFGADTLERTSLGGSESAAIYVGRALSEQGARVRIFCNTAGESTDERGLSFGPAEGWPMFAKATPHDVCIVQRTHEAFAQRTAARLNLLWCHDLALGRHEQQLRSVLWNVDRVLVVSDYMRDQYRQVYGLRDADVLVTRNGVDRRLFADLAAGKRERDRFKLMWGARPERGLDVLLRRIMPELLRRDPRFRLYIAGYDNRPAEWREFYQECERLAAALGDRVVSLGCLPKRALYAHYLSAGAYVYPTPSPALPSFREVSCISAMECQAAGLPIVTSAIGALSETVAPDAGILIEGDPSDPASLSSYVERFCDGVVGLAHDDRAWQVASARGRERAAAFDWSDVARDWLAEFERLIRQGNDSPERLVRHMWRTSDIVAAKRVVARIADRPMKEALESLLSPWSFMEEEGGYHRQYERIGVGHDPGVYESAPEEPRFGVLDRWLGEHSDRIESVLDYGCAHGAYAIGLAQRREQLRFRGVDIDRLSTDMATDAAGSRGVSDRATFSALGEGGAQSLKTVLGDLAGTFDCALLQEVLEHVPEPWTVLERVERQVRAGGKVYITVPYGPWEFTSYKTYPHRCHIWHFDQHDLRDMLGSKPELTIEALWGRDNPITGDPEGWWIVTYTANCSPIPPIDLERHAWLQRPRQSVTAGVIAGAASEETLHWMLRSLDHLVDDIILVDCGMSPEAKRIASAYKVRCIAGVDPLTEGFERARNLALDASSSDWFLWVDTDERLVGAQALEKYLRDNRYQGYAVRQHHFACDATIPVDTPVRLFRRRPFDGSTLRFWGAIHEHPEFEVNSGPGPTICLPDVHIAHVGYLAEGVRRGRLLRNAPLLRLDQERYPDRLLQKYFIMRDNMHLVRYALLAGGGRVDEDMRTRCLETVALFRKHFLGTHHQMRRSALEYYSEALTVLGEGFEAVFQLNADKSEAKVNGVQRYRFASSDELYEELKRAAQEKATRFDTRWW